MLLGTMAALTGLKSAVARAALKATVVVIAGDILLSDYDRERHGSGAKRLGITRPIEPEPHHGSVAIDISRVGRELRRRDEDGVLLLGDLANLLDGDLAPRLFGYDQNPLRLGKCALCDRPGRERG